MNTDKEAYKKFSIECGLCKTRFEIWLLVSNYTPELVESIRKNFSHYCPVCKIIEEIEKNGEKD